MQFVFMNKIPQEKLVEDRFTHNREWMACKHTKTLASLPHFPGLLYWLSALYIAYRQMGVMSDDTLGPQYISITNGSQSSCRLKKVLSVFQIWHVHVSMIYVCLRKKQRIRMGHAKLIFCVTHSNTHLLYSSSVCSTTAVFFVSHLPYVHHLFSIMKLTLIKI